MAYRNIGTCPVATAVFIRKQADRLGTSINEAIRQYSVEAEIPVETLRNWVYRGGQDENEPPETSVNPATATPEHEEDEEEMPGRFVTTKGYDVWEVLSALQKSIRRGLEDDALFWATELYKSGMGGHAWNRLLIIVSEDIGVAEPTLPATIWALFSTYERLRKTGDGVLKTPAILQLVHAVMLMARARKSRAVDWACCVLDNNPDDRRQIPDFALDKHTRRGRAMGRGFRHFIEVGSLLENEADVEDPYREPALALLLAEEPVEEDLDEEAV